MLQRLLLIFILSVLTSKALFAQQGFLPRKMDKAINSPLNEFNPVVSADGKQIYFVRANHVENNHNPEKHLGPQNSHDIWFSELQPDDSWSPAERLEEPLNTAFFNSVLSIMDNNKTILINGTFDKKNRWLRRGLSISKLDAGGWSQPEALKIKGKLRNNRGAVSTAFISSDGETLFLSFSSKEGGKKEDLYISKKENTSWGKPVKLKAPLNSRKYSETAPFFHEKEQKLYFSSNRNHAKKDKDNYDIFYTKPKDKSMLSWSDPIRMNDTVNGKGWDSYYKVNEAGSVAYFSRKDPGSSESDIYILKLIEENPIVEVSGTIFSNFNNEPLDPKHEFKVYVNDQIVDSIILHPQSSHYVLKLPLGRKYKIKAVAKNHMPIEDSIDVREFREYMEVEKNLHLEPVPFVVLSGKILLKNNLAPLPDSSDAKLFVNGKQAILTEWNKGTGDYKLNLKFGIKNKIVVEAKGFDKETAVIDLTPVNKYTELQRDFYIQKLVVPDADEAIITGKIIDKKTGKPLSPDKTFSIFANDIPTTEVSIDNNTAEYKLVVPLGKRYIINAISPNYYPVYELIDLSTQKARIKINKDLIIAPIEVGMSVKLNNIFFETGKATLKKSSFQELDRIIKFLKENESIKIEIRGYTDNVGKPETNFLLSENRANAVVKYILEGGVDSKRLIGKGYGMKDPVASNANASGRAMNRRVEFMIMDK